jgi:hypothetical protein
MVRVVNRARRRDDIGRATTAEMGMREEPMIGRLGGSRDPFEGKGAQRRQLRLRIEGILALTMALAACGLTAALWIMTLAPVARLYGLG